MPLTLFVDRAVPGSSACHTFTPRRLSWRPTPLLSSRAIIFTLKNGRKLTERLLDYAVLELAII
jgi:hypothetical protein